MWIDDQVLDQCDRDITIQSWIPETPVVVLGRSNKRGTEVNYTRCEADGIAVLKRLGGGGTVLLHKECLVVSCGIWVSDYYKNDLYFRLLNQSLIDVLEEGAGGSGFTQRGYSDIVLGDRKLVGTSLFRSRNFLLYQASVLVDARADLMETYLRHPSLEPDYRQGRSHKDFVLGLKELVPHEAENWLTRFQRDLPEVISRNLGEELIASQPKQVIHVKSRIAEARDLD